MKVLYYDCFAGISGDMHLGALIDAGVDPDHLVKELEKLPLKGFRLNIERDHRCGIEGTRVDVVLEGKDHHHHEHDRGHSHDNRHNHDHSHGHDHSHSHGHDHNHGHSHSHESGHHEHRNLHDIEQIISKSTLHEAVKMRAMKMFMLIAKAESKIHGVPVDKIHFHEVGAVDSIVDVTGAAICIEYLKPDLILSSAVELGGGTVRCAHGIMPVPAPATAEILKDVPVKLGSTPHEATTPTGAAILKANVIEFTDQVRFSPEITAYGIGQRDTEFPNVLRVYLGEKKKDTVISEKTGEKSLKEVPYFSNHYMIECNIDDMNPEWYDFVMQKLFSQGADDVFIVPIIQKKNRPAAMLCVLCAGKLRQELTETLLLETTTLGVRSYHVEKQMLRREIETFETSLGEVRIKKAWYKDRLLKWKPEYDDCRKLANKHNLTLQVIYRTVESECGLAQEALEDRKLS